MRHDPAVAAIVIMLRELKMFGMAHAMKGGLGTASVTVAGDLSTRDHDGKTYLTVRVAEITLQGGKSDGQQRDTGTSYGGGYGAGGSPGSYPDEQDIPFAPSVL